jgi:hypothetical protein
VVVVARELMDMFDGLSLLLPAGLLLVPPPPPTAVRLADLRPSLLSRVELVEAEVDVDGWEE